MIEIKDLSVTYDRDGKTPYEALDHVRLTVPKGTVCAVLGPSGCGKSTLIKAVAGLLPAASGMVTMDSTPIDPRRMTIGFIPQNYGLLPWRTALENVLLGPAIRKQDVAAAEARAAELFKVLGIAGLEARYPRELSGGQQRRVAIAGILALQPRYLVLDEPTAGLDPCGRAQLMQLLRELHKKQRMTLVLITHNMDDIAELADQLIILHQGVLLAVGEPRELFQQRELLQQAGLQPPQVVQVLDVLRAHGLSVPETAMTLQEAVKAVQQAVKKHKGGKKC